MNEFTIYKNEYLKQNIRAFYHTDYLGYKEDNNPDYINILKNTYNSYNLSILNKACNDMEEFLYDDISEIVSYLKEPILICVVPRSKINLENTQLLFKDAIFNIVWQIDNGESFDYSLNGVDCITRYKNTYTTHLRRGAPNYNNDGPKPYPGITKDTCHIDPDVNGKNILLIDDIYTKGVNIDEDAIQALLDNGAKSVVFYAVAKTVERDYHKNTIYNGRNINYNGSIDA